MLVKIWADGVGGSTVVRSAHGGARRGGADVDNGPLLGDAHACILIDRPRWLHSSTQVDIVSPSTVIDPTWRGVNHDHHEPVPPRAVRGDRTSPGPATRRGRCRTG